MSAREEILARIREATKDIKEKDPVKDVPVTWAYDQPTPLEDVLETFVENILDYKARITRTPASGTGEAIVTALKELGARTVVIPDGAPQGWVDAVTVAGLEVVRDTQLSHQQLNDIDAVLTGSAVSMAETGTIALDHSADQGRRALTLVPDRHVCVVRAETVVSDVPEAVHRLKPAVVAGQPVTWISGGSATSDIELSRVEGVHGPRQLYVVLEEG
ncbi:lactate utilization protein C [Arachnia propionica]|uniref:Lactate utilization protein C n=1 Tax=Arachnia propionica TaxID=1750 RepID=A0A3P1T1Z0_9ACTN|nr:lactate utilization protein C [Arachnia propionica]MDO5084076.1 lactate utilization protein C [Arachnia propionica]RRD03430.1 lactate utilization protein C [Arachnia propionica]